MIHSPSFKVLLGSKRKQLQSEVWKSFWGKSELALPSQSMGRHQKDCLTISMKAITGYSKNETTWMSQDQNSLVKPNKDECKSSVHCAGGEFPAGLMDRRKQPQGDIRSQVKCQQYNGIAKKKKKRKKEKKALQIVLRVPCGNQHYLVLYNADKASQCQVWGGREVNTPEHRGKLRK